MLVTKTKKTEILNTLNTKIHLKMEKPFKYYPQINGIKEEIILDKNIGENVFKSKLNVNGCFPKINDDGSISIISNETKEEVQNFIAPFAYDSKYTAGIADEHFVQIASTN